MLSRIPQRANERVILERATRQRTSIHGLHQLAETADPLGAAKAGRSAELDALAAYVGGASGAGAFSRAGVCATPLSARPVVPPAVPEPYWNLIM